MRGLKWIWMILQRGELQDLSGYLNRIFVKAEITSVVFTTISPGLAHDRHMLIC